MKEESELPRRIFLDKYTPAEKAIYDAMQAVEHLPPDTRLTEAVILLSKAKDFVADYVDNIPHKTQEDAITSNQYIAKPTDKKIFIDEKWEPLAYVNANPDEGYVLRILDAHLRNCIDGRWVGESPIVAMMNKWQDDRAQLLRKTIHQLQNTPVTEEDFDKVEPIVNSIIEQLETNKEQDVTITKDEAIVISDFITKNALKLSESSTLLDARINAEIYIKENKWIPIDKVQLKDCTEYWLRLIDNYIEHAVWYEDEKSFERTLDSSYDLKHVTHVMPFYRPLPPNI